MAVKSKSTIARHLRELRKVQEETSDPIVRRMAYEIYEAVRWATSRTVGWPGLAAQAKDAAAHLRDDLEKNP